MNNTTEENKSYTGWIIAVLSTWFIPIIGFPVIICGLVKAWKSKNTPFMVCAIIGLALVTLNAAFGAYLAAASKL